MIDPVQKRCIIVTGASRGLGREIALTFGKSGCRVVVNYLTNRQSALDVADEIARCGGEAIPIKADTRLAREVDAMISETTGRWGRVDVLVNNAGIARDELLLRMREQDWDDVLNTNLKGSFNCIRALLPIMVQQEEGHIINIASIVGMHGREGQANYSASKAGLIGLTKSSARELGRFNIKVNAVLPGYLQTDMADNVSRRIRDRIVGENALKRVSDAVEVAEFIVYLSWMNNVSGQVFNLDSRIL